MRKLPVELADNTSPGGVHSSLNGVERKECICYNSIVVSTIKLIAGDTFPFIYDLKLGFPNGKETIMSKIAVVYWSGTGNTEAMANAVAEGAKEKGAEASLITAGDFSAADVANYDGLAFGCPAMGDEILEEDEFQPMFDGVVSALAGKKVVLFGSYGWGDGQWMRDWADKCASEGVTLAAEPVIANEAPDDDAVAACKAIGAAIA